MSQSEMTRHLGAERTFQTARARISEYESGKREPPLLILLAYSRVAQVHLEILIDDEATLPDRLPGNFNFNDYKQQLRPVHPSGETVNG